MTSLPKYGKHCSRLGVWNLTSLFTSRDELCDKTVYSSVSPGASLLCHSPAGWQAPQLRPPSPQASNKGSTFIICTLGLWWEFSQVTYMYVYACVCTCVCVCVYAKHFKLGDWHILRTIILYYYYYYLLLTNPSESHCQQRGWGENSNSSFL